MLVICGNVDVQGQVAGVQAPLSYDDILDKSKETWWAAVVFQMSKVLTTCRQNSQKVTKLRRGIGGLWAAGDHSHRGCDLKKQADPAEAEIIAYLRSH